MGRRKRSCDEPPTPQEWKGQQWGGNGGDGKENSARREVGEGREGDMKDRKEGKLYIA